MRIAYVTETYPPELNGVSLTVKRCEEFLRRCGHELEMIRPRQAHERNQDDRDGWLAPGMRIPVYRDLRFGFPATRRLLQRWRKSLPQLIHIATEGPLGWSACRAARIAGIPATSDFRTNFHQYSRYYRLGWMENLLVGYFRTFHNATARTFVPTAALRDEMSAAGFRNLAVVGRGVDTQLFDPLKRSAELRRHWGAASGTCVFLYVGRLAAEKNMGVLFESVQRAKAMAPDTKLVVVGDGPLRKALQRCHPEAIFLGLRQGEELARVYASCDAFLFPSRTDTFGNVVMEAMASGLLLVAFDSGAAHEHVFSRPFATPSSLPSPASDDDFIDVACQLVLHPYRFRGLRQDMRSRALATGWDEVLNGFNRQLEDVADSMSAAHGTSPVDT